MSDDIVKIDIYFVTGQMGRYIKNGDNFIKTRAYRMAKNDIASRFSGLEIVDHSKLVFSHTVLGVEGMAMYDMFIMTVSVRSNALNLWKLTDPEKYKCLMDDQPGQIW